MPPLYLSEADVKRLLDMRTAIEVVEEAFRQWADRKVCNVPRTRAKGNGIVVHTMSASADYLGLAGWKCYATTRAGAAFHLGLYDSRTGALIALIEAEWLGRLRTGGDNGGRGRMDGRRGGARSRSVRHGAASANAARSHLPGSADQASVRLQPRRNSPQDVRGRNERSRWGSMSCPSIARTRRPRNCRSWSRRRPARCRCSTASASPRERWSPRSDRIG